jgi:hypothetical protein
MGYIILLLTLFFPLNALAISATSVTVCDSGSGCNYTTIAAALAGVGNGNHTITVHSPYSGNESITISKHGAGVGSDLTIQNNPGDTITVRSFTLTGTDGTGAYLKIKGLRFYSTAGETSIYVNTANVSYVTIDGCTFTGAINRERAIDQVLDHCRNAIFHWTVKNCTFSGPNTGGGEPEVIWEAGYSLIENNEQVGGSSDFIYIMGHHIVFRNNKQHDCSTTYMTGYDFIQMFSAHGLSDEGHDIIIEGNEQYNMQTSNGYQTLGNFSQDQNLSGLHDITVRNNIFYNVNNAGWMGIANMKFYNNLYTNCVATDVTGPLQICKSTNNDWYGINMTIKNNIFIGNGSNNNGDGWYQIAYNTPSGLVRDYNYISRTPVGTAYTVFNAPWQTSGQETHGINGGNPHFVDFTNHNYHLTSESTVLLDKGADLSGTESCINIGADNTSYCNWTYFNYDKDGNPRPSGAWDIGPYEYGVSPRPNPPGNLKIIN